MIYSFMCKPISGQDKVFLVYHTLTDFTSTSSFFPNIANHHTHAYSSTISILEAADW